MSGPRTTRLNTAPQPTLTQPSLDLLTSIFGGGGGGFGGGGAGIGPNFFTNLFQRARAGTTGAPQNPLAAGANIGERIQNTFASPTQRGIADFYAQLFAPGGMDRFSGQGVLNAAQPLFQRNLADALATQREAGPRFASGQNLLAGQTSERALQDFNLFSQNVLQQGQQTALQALAGAQNFGGQQQELLSQLLGALFTGGGINAPAEFQRTGGGFGRFLGGLGGTLGGAFLGPIGAAAGASVGSKLFGGGR